VARRKTPEASVHAKMTLGRRLAIVRLELYGNRGAAEMARRLGLPVRTWYNYEAGVTIPAEIILKVIKSTSVEAGWLLDGQGPKFRVCHPVVRTMNSERTTTIGALVRTALYLVENPGPAADARIRAIRVPSGDRNEIGYADAFRP
jgi:hypothetical protein